MKQVHKDAWLAALRSGDYVQGRGTLKSAPIEDVDDPAKHCCLGVFCDVMAKQFPQDLADLCIVIRVGGGQIAVLADGDPHYDVLPERFARWISRYSNERGHVVLLGDGDYADRTLVELNDDGVGFDRIAELIEQYIPVDDEETAEATS